MCFTNDEELIVLRDSLYTLMKLVDKLYVEKQPYFYRFLDRMKNNIETFIYIEKGERMEPGDRESLAEILCRDWDEVNREDLGIPSYHEIFSEEIRYGGKEIREYMMLLWEIDGYFYKDETIENVYNERQEKISGGMERCHHF